ncbi:acetolactate synthase large subunit [Qipengyuania flava]|jgi:acetolactate synthase I/II/III large subunit|uniref:Acetolactate synthase large subunit n=6 Tax=Sphingomonadales TaxID=204457 RepID=A0A418NQH1_9SPHN|nr:MULTISPECIES: acetolactate synthase large subunit [Sphingomonadales]WBY15470.1 acetolactate synthase large subunit [Erythrobacteraceae bacterium WH01K]ABC62987.1 putative acetolactate synthase, catabolic [Erythrobacter litoralis HTCC2594]ASP30578.1 acetolactate synthase large subunit [Qipengyuania flava]MBO9503059.1 acetolactate synthase large subunit [Qipengyuania flava]MBS7671113.1 acetolactate synthase large subunit [Croceicoccus gelatinilyticus]|tara:strand:- start:358 stop:1998 length:1641 start_codon:yes stop_codon:yes gene_type:complete
MKASDLFIAALEAEKVEYIFAVPGEENLDLLESLRTSSIELVLTRHEQGAGFMAATYGRLTGKAGVCLATLGPGATNLTTPAAYAALGAFPLIIITGQKPIKTSKQAQFQIVDVVSLFTPLCKASTQIVNGNRIPSLVREGFRLAQEERPGAVLLELPEDIAEEETIEPVIPPHQRRYAVAGDAALDEAAERIIAAERPLLLIGAGANRRRASKALRKFVSDTGFPFFDTQMGKGVVDEDSELYLGTAALSSDDYVHCAIEKADLIVNIGHDVVEKPPFFMEPDGQTVIHINYKAAEVDQVYFPQLEVIGDIAGSVERLGNRLDGNLQCDRSYYTALHHEIASHISETSDDDRFPMVPQRVVADVRSVMARDDIVALDNGIYKIWFARNYIAHEPGTILLDNALATMGAGLPSAMMAAILTPGRRVLAVCGDGGFMMNSQELETAVRLGLNLVVLILNDAAYGMIRWKQGQLGFPDYGLTFSNPDFVTYAKSYGATGHRVERSADLVSVLNAAFEAGGVHLVDLPVDYSENKKVLIDELGAKVCEL